VLEISRKEGGNYELEVRWTNLPNHHFGGTGIMRAGSNIVETAGDDFTSYGDDHGTGNQDDFG